MLPVYTRHRQTKRNSRQDSTVWGSLKRWWQPTGEEGNTVHRAFDWWLLICVIFAARVLINGHEGHVFFFLLTSVKNPYWFLDRQFQTLFIYMWLYFNERVPTIVVEGSVFDSFIFLVTQLYFSLFCPPLFCEQDWSGCSQTRLFSHFSKPKNPIWTWHVLFEDHQVIPIGVFIG